jgi:uncharacterized membrane protein YhiD involved in acid resistance
MMGPELALSEALLRLGLVAVLAGAVGVERELREQEAGLRTHMLVGSAPRCSSWPATSRGAS